MASIDNLRRAMQNQLKPCCQFRLSRERSWVSLWGHLQIHANRAELRLGIRRNMGSSGGVNLPWFAVYVKGRHEKNVALGLQIRGLESFLPTYMKRHKNSTKSEVPLFPGYVFCRMEPKQHRPVITTPGVFSVVSTGAVPASVPDAEIEAIRHMVEAGLAVQPWPYIARGQQVQLKSGPLRGVEGIVMNDQHHRWLILSVHLLQRSIAVKVERDYVC